MTQPWYTRHMPFFFLTFLFAPLTLLLLVWRWDQFDGHERGIKLFFAIGMTAFIVFGLLPRGSLPIILPVIGLLIALKLVLNIIKRKTG